MLIMSRPLALRSEARGGNPSERANIVIVGGIAGDTYRSDRRSIIPNDNDATGCRDDAVE
jgi:ribosome biogenesis SPOUT family RNA methylase Rps3